MRRVAQTSPSYRRQKRKDGNDLAFVEIKGKRHYLGAYNSPESRQAYHRLLAEAAANGGTLPVLAEDITVVEIIERFLNWARGYYVKHGNSTTEPENLVLAMRRLKRLYGSTNAAEFGPRALKVVREEMVKEGLSRKYVNKNIGRIRRLFKWAVAEELIPPSVYHGLQAVTGLKFGRTEAPEIPPVRPAPQALITPVREHVSAPVRAMIDLQLLTGARPGELVIMRPMDLETNGKVWTYMPASHKTEHHGYQRTIPLGPRARQIVEPFLAGRQVNAYLFSPAEAEEARRAKQHAQRLEGGTPISCGNRPGTNRRVKPLRTPGDRYTTTSYARAIAYGCEQAFPLPKELGRQMKEDGKLQTRDQWRASLTPEKKAAIRQWRREHHWHPHQLRHSYATNVRRQHGLEIAQILLGHAKADVTQIYAERDLNRAIEIARKIG